jgi:hypothetical protein
MLFEDFEEAKQIVSALEIARFLLDEGRGFFRVSCGEGFSARRETLEMRHAKHPAVGAEKNSIIH